MATERAFAECPGCGGFFSPRRQDRAPDDHALLACPDCGELFVFDMRRSPTTTTSPDFLPPERGLDWDSPTATVRPSRRHTSQPGAALRGGVERSGK
jgi:hypothetical protein